MSIKTRINKLEASQPLPEFVCWTFRARDKKELDAEISRRIKAEKQTPDTVLWLRKASEAIT